MQVKFSRNHDGDPLVIVDGKVAALAKNCDGYSDLTQYVISGAKDVPEFMSDLYTWLSRVHFEYPADEIVAARFGAQLAEFIRERTPVKMCESVDMPCGEHGNCTSCSEQ